MRPSKSLKSTTRPLLAATQPRTFHDVGAPSTFSSVNVEHFPHTVTSQKTLMDFDRRLAERYMGAQHEKDQLGLNPVISSEAVLDEGGPAIKINVTQYEDAVRNVYKGKQTAQDDSPSSSRSPSRSRSRLRKVSGRRKSRSPWKNQWNAEENVAGIYISDTLEKDLFRIIREDKILYEKILRYEVCSSCELVMQKLIPITLT